MTLQNGENERRVAGRYPIVNKAFKLARHEYKDPRLVDALRLLCNKIAEGPATVKKAAKNVVVSNGSNGGKVVGVTGVTVGTVNEFLDWLWNAGFPAYAYPTTHEFLHLPLIEGAITAILVAVAAWIARGVR